MVSFFLYFYGVSFTKIFLKYIHNEPRRIQYKSGDFLFLSMVGIFRPVRCGVSKGVEDGHRLPALWVGHSGKGCKAVLGVACSQGVEGLGPGETLGSPWLPLATGPDLALWGPWAAILCGGPSS
jgi:hypothetical protein